MKTRLMISKASLRVNDYRLTIFFVLIFILYSLIFNHSVFAQSAATSSAVGADSVKEKVKQLQKDIASKAANIKLEVSNKIQNKAILGQILSVDSNQLTIVTTRGNRIVAINQYTEYKGADTSNSKKLTNLSLKDLTISSYVVALGDIDDQNKLNAKRVIKIKKLTPVSSYINFGQIQLFQNSILRLLTRDNQIQRVTLNGTTSIMNQAGETDTTALVVGKKVVAVSEASTSAVASLIYIPNESSPTAKLKTATSSATPSATGKKP